MRLARKLAHKAYRVAWDESVSTIEETDPDSWEAMSFAAAKRELLLYLRDRRDDYASAVRQIMDLKEEDV